MLISPLANSASPPAGPPVRAGCATALGRMRARARTRCARTRARADRRPGAGARRRRRRRPGARQRGAPRAGAGAYARACAEASGARACPLAGGARAGGHALRPSPRAGRLDVPCACASACAGRDGAGARHACCPRPGACERGPQRARARRTHRPRPGARAGPCEPQGPRPGAEPAASAAHGAPGSGGRQRHISRGGLWHCICPGLQCWQGASIPVLHCHCKPAQPPQPLVLARRPGHHALRRERPPGARVCARIQSDVHC